MADIKETLKDEKIGKFVLAGIAVLGLIFMFACPLYSFYGSGIKFSNVFDLGVLGGGSTAFVILLTLVNLILPFVLLVLALVKKNVGPAVPIILFCTTLLQGLTAPLGLTMGIGLILNCILYAGATAFCFIRK